MLDNQTRQLALNPTQSFIVQAPAGSGKTQLLTSRLLSLLANRVTTPESILAITFTRKAAHEMKRRVMHALHMGQGPMPEEPHQQALWHLANAVLEKDKQYHWDLLVNAHRLRIMTIDALCSSITHQLPLSSRLGADPHCVEYAGSLYIQAAQDTVHRLLKAENHAIQTLLLHLNNRQTSACDMIANLLASREQWLSLLYSHKQSDHQQLREVLEHNLANLVQESFDHTMADLWGVDWDGLTLYMQYAAAFIELPAQLEHLQDWRAITRWLCTQEGELRQVVDKRQGFPAASGFKNKEAAATAKAMKTGFMAWLNQVRDDRIATAALKELMFLPDPQYSDAQWDVLNALFDVLPQAVEQLYVLFEARGETDFNAVARCALTALGDEDNPTDLDLKLDHAIQHILVDEFQDTSASQFELIRRMVAYWDNSGEKTLFLVGDPMQSIYGFRQAEVGGFLKAQQFGMGPVSLTPLHLQSNFRSEKPIIDWINQYMPNIFASTEDIYLGAISYAPFEAQIQSTLEARVFPVWVKDSKVLSQSMVNTLIVLDRDPAIQSIAILVRQRNHIDAILPALRQAQLAYQAVDIEKITQTPCVRQLLQLTRAYLNKADQQAWLSVFMSPYIGLSLVDVTHLCEHASLVSDALSDWESIAGISHVGRAILTRVAPMLTDWMAHRHRLPLSQTIEGVWYALGGPASLQTAAQSSDAEPFFKLLRACDQGGTLNLVEFENRLGLLFSQASAAAKIQIMTIHRAKGLEFDAVLIPGVERQPKASEKPLLLWDASIFAPIHATQSAHDPIYEFIWRKHKTRVRHEQSRLLYVALTRAKKRLYLFAEKTKARQDSFLGLLQPAFDALPDIVDSHVDEPASTEIVAITLHRLEPHWQHPYIEQLLQAHQSANSPHPNPFDHDAISPSRFQDKTLGTVIHHILYLWAEQPDLMLQSITSQLPHWSGLLKEYGLSNTLLQAVASVMARVQLDPRAQSLLSPQQEARNEYEITGLVDGKIQSFIIDRTFIDLAGVRVIVDYKTGTLDKPAYWEQLRNYARALHAMDSRPIRLCLYSPITGEYLDRIFDIDQLTPVY